MKLDVRDLSFGSLGQQEEMAVELFRDEIDEDIVAERTKGKVKLTKLDTEILVKFEGESRVKLSCDRCLSEFRTDIPIKFSQEYVLGQLEQNESQLQVSKDFTIDLLEPVRQEIMVKLPIKKLCKNDCAGICQSCGKNLNMEKCNCKKEK